MQSGGRTAAPGLYVLGLPFMIRRKSTFIGGVGEDARDLATNQDLRQLLSDGRFRLDLYHRIAGWVVELPPLRERVGDIPGLAALFLVEEGRMHRASLYRRMKALGIDAPG